MFDTLPVFARSDESPLAAAGEQISDMMFHRVNENACAARAVHAAHRLWDVRMGEAAATDGDAGTAWNECVAEVAVLLAMPYRSAREFVEIGYDLEYRLTRIDEVFSIGELDYARVRTLCSVLRQASDDTVRAIEEPALAAAAHLSPGPLRNAVWRLWMECNPDEAAAAREANQVTSRTAYVRRGADGLSWLSACITDLEGYEATRLIDEIADTVCSADPRERHTVRADGLMALLHGERILACRCGGPECPTAGVTIPPRRAPLLQILIDADTLLGLTSTPATLGDGTPLDPAVARLVAEDSTWQAILTELRTIADGQKTPPADAATGAKRRDEPAAVGSDMAAAAESADAGGASDVEREPPSGTSPQVGLTDEPESVPPPPSFTYAEFVGRGRRRPAGAVPTLTAKPASAAAPVGVGMILDDLHEALATDPAFEAGAYPDGHGGHLLPPPGALTYRPGAVLAALVRAMHPTCTFPGCAVPSRDCELDHQVPFDHEHPEHGGWTIASNLGPLCKKHHQLKTKRRWSCTRLRGGALRWVSRSGITRITIPTHTVLTGTPPEPEPDPPAPPARPPRPPSDPITAAEATELLYEPTWWETHMQTTPPPALVDVAKHPALQYLRDHHDQHRAITAARDRLAPPPF